MKIENLGHWARDYFHLIRGHGHSFIFRKPPKHYLGHIIHGKTPIILIPGVFSKWNFLKKIADPLSLNGHPVYVLEHLGYNAKDIPSSSKLVREFIDEEKLKNVVIIAHSKGGLMGKYLLVSYNKDRKIKKLVAIATPFGGSSLAKLIPLRQIKELHPEAEIIKNLQKEKSVNKDIISIFPIFDNHVWPVSSSYLEGARNIQINVHGHHKIAFDKRVRDLIASNIEGL